MGQTLRCKLCGIIVRSQPKITVPVRQEAPVAAALTPDSTTVAVETAAQPQADVAFDFLAEAPRVRPLQRRRPRFGRWVKLSAVLLLLAAAGVGAFVARSQIRSFAARFRAAIAEATTDGGEKAVDQAGNIVAVSGPFPRRALAICVSNYIYANPVSYGSPEHNMHTLMDRMVHILHIPQSQVVELTDVTMQPPRAERRGPNEKNKSARIPSTPAPPARAPLKPVIEKTIGAFLDSSRQQDRIILLFIGHIVMIEDAAYLAPLEGELDVKESLIPLAWVYEKMQKCPAQQKALVVDTCRLDPARGLERPGSGPMDPKLEALLMKPPAGIQVWSACAAEEYSYEVDSEGIFLRKLSDALSPDVFSKKQAPGDPLPIDDLAETVDRNVTREAERQLKAKEKPMVFGLLPENPIAYDRDDPLPARLEIPKLAATGASADRNEVHRIFEEIRLPPIKMVRADSSSLQPETLLPFDPQTIARYDADYRSLDEIQKNSEKHPLRAAVLEAVQLMNQLFDPKRPAFAFRESFGATSNQKVKEEILNEQTRGPATVLLQLEESLEKLRKVGEERDNESSKRWQAHYDYVLAQLLARIAYVQEYDQALGKIRKDELPELTPNVHSGWRLASREKLIVKDARERAGEAKKILSRMAKKYKGTPWEVLAKRAQLTALGLEWQPTS
jgi:hypothetical protein